VRCALVQRRCCSTVARLEAELREVRAQSVSTPCRKSESGSLRDGLESVGHTPLREEVQALTDQMDFERDLHDRRRALLERYSSPEKAAATAVTEDGRAIIVEMAARAEGPAQSPRSVASEDEDYNWEGYLERPTDGGDFEKVFVEIRSGKLRVLRSRTSQSLLNEYSLSALAEPATLLKSCPRSFQVRLPEAARFRCVSERRASQWVEVLRIYDVCRGCGCVNFSRPRSQVAAKSQRRTVPCATASSMCASIASLASKNPGLWKSSRTLARCGGEDFVAALIFTAAGLPTWSRDPKRTLLAALCGNVAHEAAKALQSFWRQSRRTVSVYQPRPPKEPANGYSPYRVDKASTHHGSFPTPKASPKVYFQEGEARRGWGQQSVGSEKNGTAPAPGPTKKSNPRPVQSRAVPVNPLQAMKNRLAQQQQDAEDRRLHGLQQAEDARLARVGVPETGLRAPQGTGPGSWSSHHSEKSEEAWDEVGERTPAPPAPPPAPKASEEEPPRPIVASGQYEPGHSVPVARDVAPAAVEPSAASPPPAPSALGDSMPTPLERRQMRQLAANSSSPSPREAVSEGATPAGSAPATCLAATERLRDRLKKREGSGRTGERTRSVPDASSMVNWQERIELRHKEAEEQQVHEREEKQRTAERSTKRNDALKRVMERREQRQADAVTLGSEE
ncbi:unnamed protein product, partial [Symbiodinium sp. CCMP2456]